MNEDPQSRQMEWLSSKTRSLLAKAGEISVVGASASPMPFKELFTAEGFPCEINCQALAVREHILYHLNAVDWSSYSSVKRMMPIVEAAIEAAEHVSWSGIREEIVNSMAEDGLKIINGKVFRRSSEKTGRVT